MFENAQCCREYSLLKNKHCCQLTEIWCHAVGQTVGSNKHRDWEQAFFHSVNVGEGGGHHVIVQAQAQSNNSMGPGVCGGPCVSFALEQCG